MEVTDSALLAAEFIQVLALWRHGQLDHLLAASAQLPPESVATGPSAPVPLH